MNDKIADLIIRIKNAGMARKNTVSVGYAKMNEAICKVLKETGFIADYSVVGKTIADKKIEITVAYEKGLPKLTHGQRISKLSKRVYTGYDEIKKVKNGYGIVIVSTPKGIMEGRQARKEQVGGELLCKIW